jgi:multidrug efflux system membrane fusion protein
MAEHNPEPAMHRSHIALLGAAGASALALSLLSSCGPASAGPADAAPPPPAVTVASPSQELVAEFSEHAGRFVATREIDIRPRVSGFLQQIHFQEGDVVEKGQLLFTIDSAPFKAEVDRAQANLTQAEVQLSLATDQFNRGDRLMNAGAMSAEEHNRRRETVASARAQRDAARAALAVAQLDLGYTRVVAPISGRVSDAHIDPGNVVEANASTLTRLVALDPIHFEFAASEDALSGVGGPRLTGREDVAVRLDGEGDYGHAGRLDFLDNAIDATTGTIRGRAVFDNADGRFTPGQYGRLRVLTPATAPAVLVPETAIASDQSRRYVLVVNDQNIVEYRGVVLGPQHGAQRVIREGLAGNERVVVNGMQRAFPGAPVTPETASAQAANTSVSHPG